MGKKNATVIYYDIDTEEQILEHTEGPLPPMGSLLQIQETDRWYSVEHCKTVKDGLEIGLRQVGNLAH